MLELSDYTYAINDYAYTNSQKVSLKTQGNNILARAEKGLTSVPTEEFAEKDPIITAIYYGLRGAAAGATIAAGLKACGVTIDEEGALALTGAGATIGVLYGIDKWRLLK